METTAPLIYGQISKVMAEIDAIGKDRQNLSQKYNFRGIDDVYNELHKHLCKHKIFTTTEVLEHIREERQSKSGGLNLYSILKIKFKFFAEDGSFVESIMIGEGMDSGDKASNKAMAVAHKYAFMQIFAIPTLEDKDPENESPDVKAKPQEKAEEKLVDQNQIARLMIEAGNAGWTDADVKAAIKHKWNIDSKKQIPLSGLELLISHMRTNARKK